MGTLQDMMAKQRAAANPVEEKTDVYSETSKVVAQSDLGTDNGDAEIKKPRLGFLAGKKSTEPVISTESGLMPDKPVQPDPAGEIKPTGGLARLAALANKSPTGATGGTRTGVIKPSADSGVFSLADLEATEEVGTEEPRVSYPDEIPATAPDRVLPAEMTEGMTGFVVMLNGIYQAIYDPEGFGQMVRSIMQELQENQEYKKLIVDEDVHTLMRGLRESMGMAKVVKQTKERKTGSGAKGKEPTARTASVLDTIDDMGFSASDFDD